MKDKLRPVEHGADTINWLCVSNEVTIEKHQGLFFRDRKKEIKHLPLSDTADNDTSAHKHALWSWLSSMIMIFTLSVDILELTNVGTFDADLRSIVNPMKDNIQLTKHSSKSLLSLSSANSFKGKNA
jgi:hypothetical protein